MILDFSQNGIYIAFEITEEKTVLLKHFSNRSLKNEIKEYSAVSEINLCGGLECGYFGAKLVGTSEEKSLKYKEHRYYKNEFGNKLEFVLENSRLSVVVHYQFYDEISAVRCWQTVLNVCEQEVGLEYVSSFSYTGVEKDGLNLFIPHNSWCREAEWRKYTLDELGLADYAATRDNNKNSTKRLSFSNNGCWSAKEYLPLAALENKKGALMWQIENNGSWHWEISDSFDSIYLKAGGPNDEDNFWYKKLNPGEAFESVKVCVSAAENFDAALKAMTAYRRKIFADNENNKKLPVIFNDYMHCLWADPTEEKMIPVIDKAAELGCEYYCMDAGWYADGTWWDTVGEWMEQKKRFPNGIKSVFDYIRKKGMVPGIWLEIEVMGIKCPILDKFDDSCFFMRHGKRVVNRGRYQLDFRNEKVRGFATETVDRVVKEYGAGFIKFDYNVEPGAGTEFAADSFGDGLLEHNRAYIGWIRDIKKKYPDLIVENCSSGGLRADYAMLAEHHIQSVSDQEDFKNLAKISARAATAVLPEQAAVWVYPKEENTSEETAFMTVGALLQRIYLSGEIHKIDDKKQAVIKSGIELFKSIRGEIGSSFPFYPLGIPKSDDAIQCLGFEYKDKKRFAVWCFDEACTEAFVPAECKEVKIIYPLNSDAEIKKENNGFKIKFRSAVSAVIAETK